MAKACKSGAFSTQNVPNKLHFSIEIVDNNSVMNDITNADMAVIKFVSNNDVGQLKVLFVLFLIAFKLFLFLLDKKVLKNS